MGEGEGRWVEGEMGGRGGGMGGRDTGDCISRWVKFN